MRTISDRSKNHLVILLCIGLSLLISACQPLILDEISTDAAESSAQEASPGADNLGDPYYPQMGNGGYNAQHYTIDLVVDMDGQSITGTTTIDALATQDLSALNLDFFGLEVSDIQVNDAPAQFSRDGSELTIMPSGHILNGETFTTIVAYGGVPTPVDDPGVPWLPIGLKMDESGLLILGLPSGAMSWYPSNNHPADKATYTFRITVEKPFVVAANGLQKEAIDNGDTTTYLWEASDPMASYLATINIGEFDIMTEEGPDGLPIRNYFPVGIDEETIAPFSQTSEMIEFFSSLFGPYPFEAYGAAVMDLDLEVSLENQTLSLIAVDAISEATVANMVAHEWFGNSVSPALWQDVWLHEGFGVYAEALWLEHTEGQDAMDEMLGELQYYMVRGELPPPGDPSVENLLSDTVYVRGAWTFHALRQLVGDEVFFDILRTYYERFQYENVSTSDFIAVAEEVSGQDLQSFFEDWLYSAEVPTQ